MNRVADRSLLGIEAKLNFLQYILEPYGGNMAEIMMKL